MTGADDGPADNRPTPDDDGPGPVAEPIPLTREATIDRGFAWRACLGTIRAGLLRRPVVPLVAFGIFLALPLASGMAWPGAVVQACVGTVIVLLLSVGLAWLRVRRWYPAGSAWKAGVDERGLRLAFPDHDLTLPATAIRSVRPIGDLVILTVGPRALQLAVPERLVTLPELHALMDRAAEAPVGDAIRTDLTAAGSAATAPRRPIPRREALVTPELARSIPRTLAKLELRRPLAILLLVFMAYQAYAAVATRQPLTIGLATLAGIMWLALALAPYLQGRRFYPPGTTIGAGVRDGTLSVSLADRVVEHDVSSVRGVISVPEGIAVRLANGGVLLLPAGLLTDAEVAELASTRGRRAGGNTAAGGTASH